MEVSSPTRFACSYHQETRRTLTIDHNHSRTLSRHVLPLARLVGRQVFASTYCPAR